MSFKIAAALALLPSVQAGTGLCFGDNVLDTYAAASCALKYSTQAELDAAGTCPETCHSGAGGVTGNFEGSSYTFSKGSGWCTSSLDETPTVLQDRRWFTADECWDGCTGQYGAAMLHNAQYDCDNTGCECYCQDSCLCMRDVGETSTLFKAGNSAADVCADDDDDDDDDAVEGEYYFCSCDDTVTTEAECTAKLGSGAWETLSCADAAAAMAGQVPFTMCMPAYVDMIFGPDELGGMVDNCCVDGLNGCVGVCVSSTSTVTAMTAANPKAHTLPISELAIGDKVLAQTHEGKHVFDEVEGLPHGMSAESEHFVDLVISTSQLSPARVVRATPHHTFPACSHAATFVVKTTKAKDFKAGDCVMTPAGKGKVTSAAMTPAAKDEEAYTIVLKGKHDLVAVNGVFTHAAHDSMMGRPPAKQRSALRGPRAAAPPALSGFQQHVVDAVQYRLQAAAAKA